MKEPVTRTSGNPRTNSRPVSSWPGRKRNLTVNSALENYNKIRQALYGFPALSENTVQRQNRQQKKKRGVEQNNPDDLGGLQNLTETNENQTSGNPLSPVIRNKLEPVLQHDLGQVRVHNDRSAQESASAINARAFTCKNHIYLARDEQPSDLGLMAHETTHVVQQANDGPNHLQRKPGDIPAPASAPSLTAVTGIFKEKDCGRFVRNVTKPKDAQRISDCAYHARFVNYFAQGAENIGKVSSPYAPGIAAVLKGFIPLIKAAGKDAFPTLTSPKSYKVKNPTINISPGVTVTGGELTLTLKNELNTANGSYSNGVLSLNEASQAVLLKDPTDLERTLYHECFHYFSGLVDTHNHQVRQKTARGKEVLKALDRTFIAKYKKKFQSGAKPVWKKIKKDLKVSYPLPDNKPVTLNFLLGIHWIKVVNEILSRVEEAVYLNLRQGKGFTGTDLKALQQGWLYTADYWDSGVIYLGLHLNTFLRKNKSLVDTSLLPAVQDIQLEYLKLRPSPSPSP